MERFTSRIRTRADLADASGLPIFAELPRQGSLSRVTPELLDEQPGSALDQRGVTRPAHEPRVRGQRRDRDRRRDEPGGSHGKTTIAFGLAVAIARSGAKTLLIDADLRRGRIAEMLDVPRIPGLYEAMNGSPLGPGSSATRRSRTST